MEGGSQCQNLGLNFQSSIDFEQLASSVYATECYLEFQEHDRECEIDRPLSSQLVNTAVQLPPNESPGDDTVNEYNLQTILKPYFCSNQHHESCEMFQKSLSSTTESRGINFGDFEVASYTSSSSETSAPSKKRMRWTQQLHENFINCVNNLGGAEKATPKRILKMMESKELTIIHVKSHLQKYRAEKCMSECKQGKYERTSSDISQLYLENSMQIKEALQLQLDFEKHLSEQLKVQRQLQLKIEENEKQLKMMLQQQQKINEIL